MNSNQVSFIFITSLQIASCFCAVQILLLLLQRNNSLRSFKNHSMICLLVVVVWTIFVDMPNTQKYLWTNSVMIHQPWFCLVSNASFFSMATLNRVLMAFMTIERHFLVFCAHIYRTHRSRVLFHYIPLIVLIAFVIIYISITNIFIPCPTNSFNYSMFLCGYTCGILDDSLGITYAWFLVFVPTGITMVASILLPIRFLLKRKQLQRVQWYRARKLIVQTITITVAYTLCWLPYTIILQLLINNILSFNDKIYPTFLILTPYVTSLLTPMIVLHTVSDRLNLDGIRRIRLDFCPLRPKLPQA